MEALTRLVSESLARHGFDRPLDYRRLRWSRWFRCESHHSVLVVPSKPGVFAIAEEIMDIGTPADHVETTDGQNRAECVRRMLAVTQFYEDDDMAFVLDRMMSRPNPMGARLASGRYFARFVVIEDPTQRRSICHALNQWVVSAAEKATGIGSHFASSLELTSSTEYIAPPKESQTNLFDDAAGTPGVAEATAPDTPTFTPERTAGAAAFPKQGANPSIIPGVPHLNSKVATNIHRSSQFPSGF